MPRRISADIDVQILTDIGMGVMNKDVALKYGVSASYVSKLSLGKKLPYINVPVANKARVDTIDVYENDITEIQELIKQRRILTSKDEVLNYLEEQAKKHIVRAKIYTDLIKKYKGEETL